MMSKLVVEGPFAPYRMKDFTTPRRDTSHSNRRAYRAWVSRLIHGNYHLAWAKTYWYQRESDRRRLARAKKLCRVSRATWKT